MDNKLDELETRIEAIEAKQAERFPMILSKFKHLDSAWANIKILYLVMTILVIVFVAVFFFLHIQKLDWDEKTIVTLQPTVSD